MIQGLTLKPLLRALGLRDDDPVGREVSAARGRALAAGLASLENETAAAADTVRHELSAHLGRESVTEVRRAQHTELHRRALGAARQEVLRMRAAEEIGDDAFHQVEEDLDWLDMAGGTAD